MLDGEKSIVESAVRGVSSAFGLLYDHYQPKIYRFVLIKVSQREEAEDITHQVFLHAWQNIHSYADLGFPFSSWLYRIARNQVIDHYRTKKHDVSLTELDAQTMHDGSHAGSAAEKNFELDRIRQALSQLKPEYQDVILMRFVEDLSIKETAAGLQKTQGAVKLMQYRALKQLKAILNENESA